MTEDRIREKPNLSLLALISFVVSFLIARTFTTLNPATVLIAGDYHIHHFWFGLALIVIGGWMGISYQSERIDRLAAILFGAGGGLIGDEVGILLTLSAHAYWADFSYTFVIVFLAFVSMAILINKYRKIIRVEFFQFLRSNASLYLGVFLASISIAFLLEVDNIIIAGFLGILAVSACFIILGYFLNRWRKRSELVKGES